MTTPNVHAVFVYGTLMRGEEREKLWPREPVRIEAATTRGVLYDLGPYPALVEGDDTVVGELWLFRPDDVPHTLRVLDRVEGADFGTETLYERRTISCRTASGDVSTAFAYFFVQKETLRHARRIWPNRIGSCRWFRQSSTQEFPQ